MNRVYEAIFSKRFCLFINKATMENCSPKARKDYQYVAFDLQGLLFSNVCWFLLICFFNKKPTFLKCFVYIYLIISLQKGKSEERLYPQDLHR